MDRLTQAMRGTPQDDPTADMSPIDLLKLRQALAAQQTVTPEQRAANLKTTGWDVLSSIPGPGNVIAAKDAWDSGNEAVNALGEGRLGAGAANAALSGLSGFGAVAGLPFGRLAKAVAKDAPNMAYAIPAWHGSPHDFDKFDMSKIGTGEGAQVYGHGLYFAESPTVAREYRDALSPFTVNGQPVDHRTGTYARAKLEGRLDKERNHVMAMIDSWGARRDQMAKSGEDTSQIDEMLTAKRAELDAITAVEQGDVGRGGRVYQAELDVEPEDLLDWDRSLSQQNGKIRDAFGRIRYGDNWNEYASAKETLAKPKPTLDEMRANPRAAQVAMEERAAAEKVLQRLTGIDEGRSISSEMHDLSALHGGPAGVSRILREAGIPGIRYLDAFSRGEGAGTSNYVMFDDNLIKLLSKE